MDISVLKEKLAPVLKKYFFPLILGFSGLIFLSYSLIGYFGQKQDQPDILFESASTGPVSSDDSNSAPDQSLSDQKITVDVEGAVQSPGVYKLSLDSRVQDALIAAGGLSKDADRQKISQSLNLAAKLSDSTKIYIPSVGESITLQSDPQSLVAGSSDGPLNINSASESDLDELPGIGKTTAQKIINNRPYSAPEDLLDKKIVNKKVFENIREKIIAQ